MNIICKTFEISMIVGGCVGFAYGFYKSVNNTQKCSLSTQLGLVMVNSCIMGAAGSVLGCLYPATIGVLIYRSF